jgi:hypothetical protein
MSRSITRILSVFAGLLTVIAAGASAQTSPHFVVSVNPAVVNITQGGSVTMTVTTVVDGRPDFEFSFAGLPAGVIAQTRSGRAGANTIILTALPTTITGSYSVDVTATSGNSSHTQTFTLNLKSMPPIQWEYHVEIAGTAQQFEAAANALGQQGWELVSMVVHAEEIISVFKREKL